MPSAPETDSGPPPPKADPIDAGGADAGPHTGLPTCGDIDCGLNGDCVMDPESMMPTCRCDTGYLPIEDATDGICQEDRGCVNLSVIECRSSAAEGSAVGLVVSATYCSGNPVPDLQSEDLELQELGESMGADVWEVAGTEASLTVSQPSFIPHVYVLVDMSASVVASDVLPQVRAGIARMLDELAASPKPARVAIWLFDGSPQLYPFQEETTDFDAVRARLPDLDDFAVLDNGSTDLFGAIIKGINRLEAAVQRKYLVHEDGFLATRTLVIVSDGDDDAGRFTSKLTDDRIASTTAQIITVGLGEETMIQELTRLGRDASFAAPTQARVEQAFTEIGARVSDYPESLYFLGYCSTQRSGDTAARVRITSLDVVSGQCSFSAAQFSGGCTSDVFTADSACTADGVECGGIIGCGTCPGGQACLGRACVAASGGASGARCGGTAMCEAGLACLGGVCTAAAALDATCSETEPCGRGEGYCDPTALLCTATLADGEVCEAARSCASGLCAPLPGRTAVGEPTYCQAPVATFDSCRGAGRPCEPGAFCAACTGTLYGCQNGQDSVCTPQRRAGAACQRDAECLSGDCRDDRCAPATYRHLSITP